MNLTTLIFQIGIILAAARGVGYLFRRFNQPQVMGEIVAGLLLGPSLLGWLAPGASAALFPPASLGYVNALSQVGLVIFMFLVGLALRTTTLRSQSHTVVLTSHVSIIFPFLLGAGLAVYLYPRLSDDSVSFTAFALFMGSAMSVTAFPVLARILKERNLTGSRVGTVAIACASVDDVTAWCILAAIVALVGASHGTIPLWATIAGSALYGFGMVFGVRGLLRRFEASFKTRGKLSDDSIAIILLLVLASALLTEYLGIHLLFGAFLAGVVMPKNAALVQHLTEKMESIAVIFLLPLFFALTGLRTSIGLVRGAEMWFFCGLIVILAIAGKLGGSMISARFAGMSWREAAAVGALMNTRGLMELVILNIGLDIKVISPALFSMMVLMALVTTFMTTPLLEWIYPARLIQSEPASGRKNANTAERLSTSIVHN